MVPPEALAQEIVPSGRSKKSSPTKPCSEDSSRLGWQTLPFGSTTMVKNGSLRSASSRHASRSKSELP